MKRNRLFWGCARPSTAHARKAILFAWLVRWDMSFGVRRWDLRCLFLARGLRVGDGGRRGRLCMIHDKIAFGLNKKLTYD